MSTARVMGHRVEDLSQRTETVRVYANPDGTWTSETASEPESVRDAAGTWHDIDTTLVPVEGGLAPRYAASDLRLSDGGDQAFATVSEGGRKLSWRWASALPTPTVSGSTATYADVIPGGDLVVTATATGFTHNLVLRRRPTQPVTLTMPVATDGADLTQNPSGGLTIDTPAGRTLVSAPAPVMWDATTNAAGDHPHGAAVPAAVGHTSSGTPSVTLTPGDAFLSDPATVYPVTVDPSWTTWVSGDVWVENPNYTSGQTASEELRVGTYDGGSHVARAFLHFDNLSNVQDKDVTKATLVLRNFYSGSCTGAVIRASRITSAWDGNTLTWGNQPGGGSTYAADYSPAHGYNSTCDTADASWNVTDMVNGWLSGFPNNGIKLKAPDETSSFTWRRYRSANYNGGGSSVRPHINITYNSYPDKPGTPAVTPGNTGYATTTTPTLSATVTDPDKSTVRGDFEIYPSGSTTPAWTGNSSYVSSASTASVKVPAGVLHDGTTYTAKVKGDDGTDTSKAYSTSTTFTVDTSKPNLATQDISSTVFSDGQWHADPATANSFTFHGPSDTKSFTYTEDGVTQPAKSADSAGDATVSWLPKDGWHTLSVTATDKAGNSGSKATFSFGYGLASFVTTNASARSTGVFPVQLASRPGATDATLSWRYAGTTSWHDADGVTKNGQPWDHAVANTADGTQSVTGALLWDATAQVADPTATPEKTIAAPALLELRTCFHYTTAPTQICSSALPVQLVPNAFGGNFPTTTVGPAQVALATGEMTFTEPDAVDSTAGVARTFSSFDAATVQPGPFGPGWSSTLLADGDTSAQLLDHRTQDGTLVLVTAGNASETYTLDSASSLYIPAGTDDGSRMSITADTATLTRPQSSVTSWTLQDGVWVFDTVKPTDDTNATPTVDAKSDIPGYPTWIAQTPPGVATTCNETTQDVGCRGLKISYTGDPTKPDTLRVSQIDLLTHDASTPVATYHYNADKQLESVCGPDPDGAQNPLTSLCAAYTYATVSSRTLVKTVTPPGQAPWTFGYDDQARLATVSRPLDPATNSGSGPATWTVRYDLTPTSAGLP
ncbi:MAG: DNRLRE domain-containing protein, partial [Nocardioidaceae bacterium]